MVNIYDSMLSTLKLQQLLLQVGFFPQAEAGCFQAGQVHVRMLDAPRLMVQAPSGTYYLAVLSADHLLQVLTSISPSLASYSQRIRLAA